MGRGRCYLTKEYPDGEISTFYLTRITSAALGNLGAATLEGLWAEAPEAAAGFSDMTTFYPDGGRDTQGQEISVSVPSVRYSESTCECSVSASIKLVTAGGSVPMQGGDMRRWNEFYQTETHEAVFSAVTVENPSEVAASFELAAYTPYSVAGSYSRNYTITMTYGSQSRTVASGTFGRDPVQVTVSEAFSAGLGTLDIGFKVTLSGGSGVYLSTEYVLFRGGTVETHGRSTLANGTAMVLAVGR